VLLPLVGFVHRNLSIVALDPPLSTPRPNLAVVPASATAWSARVAASRAGPVGHHTGGRPQVHESRSRLFIDPPRPLKPLAHFCGCGRRSGRVKKCSRVNSAPSFRNRSRHPAPPPPRNRPTSMQITVRLTPQAQPAPRHGSYFLIPGTSTLRSSGPLGCRWTCTSQAYARDVRHGHADRPRAFTLAIGYMGGYSPKNTSIKRSHTRDRHHLHAARRRVYLFFRTYRCSLPMLG